MGDQESRRLQDAYEDVFKALIILSLVNKRIQEKGIEITLEEMKLMTNWLKMGGDTEAMWRDLMYSSEMARHMMDDCEEGSIKLNFKKLPGGIYRGDDEQENNKDAGN